MAEHISIIISTRNRAASLRETLHSLERAAVPDGSAVELIVVDNASTDETWQVIADFRPSRLAVRYLRENRRGLSRSRNAGLAAAEGDVLLFTDDDVRVPRDWIGAMCRKIQSGEADAVAGGVRIATHLARPWMSLYIRAVLAETASLDPRSPSRLVGANMAFSRRVLSQVPSFDEELGAGAMGYGEETLFSSQLLAAGFRIAGAMDAAVEHHFDPARLSRRALLDAAAQAGASEAYVAWHWEHEFPERCDRSLASYKRDARLWAKLLWHRLHRRADNAAPISDWEIQQVKAIAFRRQLRLEMQRPRQYERRALKKLDVAVLPQGCQNLAPAWT